MNEGDGLKLLDWLGEEKAQLAFLDPQYKSTKGTSDNYYYLGNEPPHNDQDSEQIRTFCHKIAQTLKKGGFLCLWINQEILLNGEYRRWLPPELIIKSLLVWVKGKNKELYRVILSIQRNIV